MKITENLIFRRTDTQNEELLVFCGVIKTTMNMMTVAVETEEDKWRDKYLIENLKGKKKRFLKPSHNVDWINFSQNKDRLWLSVDIPKRLFVQ